MCLPFRCKKCQGLRLSKLRATTGKRQSRGSIPGRTPPPIVSPRRFFSSSLLTSYMFFEKRKFIFSRLFYLAHFYCVSLKIFRKIFEFWFQVGHPMSNSQSPFLRLFDDIFSLSLLLTSCMFCEKRKFLFFSRRFYFFQF